MGGESLEFLQRSKECIDALSKSRFILLAGSEVFNSPGDYGIRRVLSRLRRDPISVAHDYEVACGQTQAEAAGLFDETALKLIEYGCSPSSASLGITS